LLPIIIVIVIMGVVVVVVAIGAPPLYVAMQHFNLRPARCRPNFLVGRAEEWPGHESRWAGCVNSTNLPDMKPAETFGAQSIRPLAGCDYLRQTTKTQAASSTTTTTTGMNRVDLLIVIQTARLTHPADGTPSASADRLIERGQFSSGPVCSPTDKFFRQTK
jgi:hypothetical protein